MPNSLSLDQLRTTDVPLLSITVPTYNRASRLRQCLLMIGERIDELEELREAIEVLVVDNASTDDTKDVVEAGRASIPNLIYVCNERNLGIDGNIHRCSQLATGAYVQLLSDDDILLPGALRHIVEQLHARPNSDFFFLNVISFVDELPDASAFKPRLVFKADRVYRNPNEIVAACGIWLTFLSSFVFRRSAWNSSSKLKNYVGTDIYLSYALFDLLANASEFTVLARPLVAARAHFSGSYRIFYAFGYQWPELLLTHAPAIGFDPVMMRKTLHHTMRTDLLWRVLQYRLKNSELSTDDRLNIFHGTQELSLTSCLLWLSVHTPLKLLILSRTLIKALLHLIRIK